MLVLLFVILFPMVQLYYHSLVWILLALLLSRLEQVDGFKISKRNTISYSATYSSSLGNSKNIDFDFDGLQTYARICGLELKKNSNPLFLKLEAYPIGEDKPVGYLTSFIRPFPFQLLQLETIQVKNRRQYLGYKRKSWTIDGPGISFIMGSWALKWAYEKGIILFG